MVSFILLPLPVEIKMVGFEWVFSYLNVQLGKGHEHAVGNADEKTSKVHRTNVCAGHHDDVGDGAHDGSDPYTAPAANESGNGTREGGAGEGAQCHEGGDELLSLGGDVPSSQGRRILVSEDLL